MLEKLENGLSYKVDLAILYSMIYTKNKNGLRVFFFFTYVRNFYLI